MSQSRRSVVKALAGSGVALAGYGLSSRGLLADESRETEPGPFFVGLFMGGGFDQHLGTDARPLPFTTLGFCQNLGVKNLQSAWEYLKPGAEKQRAELGWYNRFSTLGSVEKSIRSYQGQDGYYHNYLKPIVEDHADRICIINGMRINSPDSDGHKPNFERMLHSEKRESLLGKLADPRYPLSAVNLIQAGSSVASDINPINVQDAKVVNKLLTLAGEFGGSARQEKVLSFLKSRGEVLVQNVEKSVHAKRNLLEYLKSIEIMSRDKKDLVGYGDFMKAIRPPNRSQAVSQFSDALYLFATGATRSVMIHYDHNFDHHRATELKKAGPEYASVSPNLGAILDMLYNDEYQNNPVIKDTPLFQKGGLLKDNVVLLVFSEFGRTMITHAVNDFADIDIDVYNSGTDHGYFTNSCILAGAGVNTRTVIGASDFSEIYLKSDLANGLKRNFADPRYASELLKYLQNEFPDGKVLGRQTQFQLDDQGDSKRYDRALSIFTKAKKTTVNVCKLTGESAREDVIVDRHHVHNTIKFLCDGIQPKTGAVESGHNTFLLDAVSDEKRPT